MKTDKMREKQRERDLDRALRRDPEFTEALAKSFGVEEAPESLHRKLEATYASLPDELRVKKRPWQAFMHTVSWAAAACVAACVILLGVNAVVPNFTESIPGLGVVFTTINSPSSDPDASVSTPTVSGFSPMPVTDNGIVLMGINLWEDGHLEIKATVPYMGQESYDPAYYSNPWPYGVYARIRFNSPDGRQHSAHGCAPTTISEREETVEGSELYAYTSDRLTVTWSMYLSELAGVSDLGDTSTCTFTLFERPYGWTGTADWEDPNCNRVTAEFTIDLATLTAKVSQNYLGEGYAKVEPEDCWRPVPLWPYPARYEVVECSDDTAYLVTEIFFDEETYNPVYEMMDLEILDASGETVGTLRWDGAILEDNLLPAGEYPFLGEIAPDIMVWTQTGDGYLGVTDTDPRRTLKRYSRLVFAVPEMTLGYAPGSGDALREDLLGDKFTVYLVDPRDDRVLLENMRTSVESAKADTDGRYQTAVMTARAADKAEASQAETEENSMIQE